MKLNEYNQSVITSSFIKLILIHNKKTEKNYYCTSAYKLQSLFCFKYLNSDYLSNMYAKAITKNTYMTKMEQFFYDTIVSCKK